MNKCCSHGRLRAEGVLIIYDCANICKYDSCIAKGGCDVVVMADSHAVAVEIKIGGRGHLSVSDYEKALEQLRRCRDWLISKGRRRVLRVVLCKSIDRVLRMLRGRYREAVILQLRKTSVDLESELRRRKHV